MTIVKVIIEGLGLGAFLYIVCAVGIRNGAVGIVHLYGDSVQKRAVELGLTPYPKYARWFTLFLGAVPVLLIGFLIGAYTALGAGIGTTFLSAGNALTFGGLLATLPDEETFKAFKDKIVRKRGAGNEIL